MRAWIASIVACGCFASTVAQAEGPAAGNQDRTWHGQAAGGFDTLLNPEFSGFGFALFQATGHGIVGGGDLRLYYNTDTVEVGLDRIKLADNLDLFIALRGEALFSGLLRYYYQNGLRENQFGFNASYLVLRNKLQWHFAPNNTFEVIADVRHWWFGDDNTDPTYILPDNTFVFEPRIGYIFWNVDSPGGEWTADKVFPRFIGNAFGVTVGIDVRSNINNWGFMDGRNDPEKWILTINQWYRGGWQFVRWFRLEVQETANWGENQDDITRQRVGGMNPYSITVPGVPWAGILSSRLLIGQASANFRLTKKRAQELGILVAGGAVNDPFREGNLDSFGGIGGIALTTDLRWGPVSIYARLGYAFPVNWLADDPFISVFGGLGVDIF